MRTSLKNPNLPELNTVLDPHLWRLLDLIQCQNNTEQGDSSIVAGDREMPLGVYPDTLVHQDVSEIMSYNTEDWIQEQNYDLVLQQLMYKCFVALSSHSICKEIFHNLCKFDI